MTRFTFYQRTFTFNIVDGISWHGYGRFYFMISMRLKIAA